MASDNIKVEFTAKLLKAAEKGFLNETISSVNSYFLLFGFITVNADGEIIICLSWPENSEVVKGNPSSRQLRLG